MRTVCFLIMAVAVALAPQPAFAQQNSVIEHYRAYNAALERGDVSTAAREAQAALDASQARDGDGGRTAVLALNLATVRLLAGEHDQARMAAQRALDLAHVGAGGVNAALAELIIARANLSMATGPEAVAAARQLDALLWAPAAEGLPDSDVYLAGEQLGDWAFANRDWVLAQRGWSAAGARAAGAARGENYGLGRARTREGIAILVPELRGRRELDRDTAMIVQ